MRFLPCALLLLVPSTLPAAEPALPFYRDKANLLIYLDGDKAVPVKSVADWQKRRGHVLAGMERVMGPLPPATRKVPLDLKVEGEETLPRRDSQEDQLRGGKGRPCVGLSAAAATAGRQAARACSACTRRRRSARASRPALAVGKNLHYALELAERGYVTLAPDYPNFGDYQASTPMRRATPPPP